MPLIAMAGDLQRSEREQPGPSDRAVKVLTFGQARVQVFVAM